MKSGYVYILINESMPGLLKIGKTTRDSRLRARELNTTGVPTPFNLAFEIFSEDHEALEESIHMHLDDFRVLKDREFYKYPLDKAINLLQSLNSPPEDSNSIYSAVEILPELASMYSDFLRPEIVSIRIIQTHERVWLEYTIEKEIAGYLRDQYIQRTDLAFICDGAHDVPMFKPEYKVEYNARKFINDLDPISIINCTNIFTEAAHNRINKEYWDKHS